MRVVMTFAVWSPWWRDNAFAHSTSSVTAVERKRVVILPADMNADIPETTRSEFTTAFEHGLARAGLEVHDASPRLNRRGCVAPECIRAVAAMSLAAAAIRLRVTSSARDYDIAIELFDGERGVMVAKTGERCELCGVAEVSDAIQSHTAALRQRLDTTTAAPARLSIHTRPKGAALSIDGIAVGLAPVTRVVVPGPHVVRAELPRHKAAERRVHAVPNVDEIVDLDLPRLDRGRETAMSRAGWSLLSVGAAALIAGVVLVAIDGRENRSLCSGEDVDPRGNCRWIYRTNAAGIGVLVSGLGLIGGGIGLVAGASIRRATDVPGTFVTRRGRVRLAIRWSLATMLSH